MVHVPDRADVHMRLRPLKFLLGHSCETSFGSFCNMIESERPASAMPAGLLQRRERPIRAVLAHAARQPEQAKT
jgi:hypothetical protein